MTSVELGEALLDSQASPSSVLKVNTGKGAPQLLTGFVGKMGFRAQGSSTKQGRQARKEASEAVSDENC